MAKLRRWKAVTLTTREIQTSYKTITSLETVRKVRSQGTPSGLKSKERQMKRGCLLTTCGRAKEQEVLSITQVSKKAIKNVKHF